MLTFNPSPNPNPDPHQVLHDSRRILVCAFDLFVPPSDTAPAPSPSPSPSAPPSAATLRDALPHRSAFQAALRLDGAISHHLLRDGAIGCLRHKQAMRLILTLTLTLTTHLSP